ncbi:uncharacterized protein [Misgurnus anguillicaudatus]|uniref:uncharacterized protein isoform X2 n=1 Tax=Misgurnus anguillicaudatus TaxID=75329 RepID=UPI003CCF46EE
MASLEGFVKEPSEELLELFTKDQLLQLASHYDITITSKEKQLKDSVKEIIRNVLSDKGVLKVQKVSPKPVITPLSEAAFELRLREIALQERQLEDKERERQIKEKQMNYEHERFLREMDWKMASGTTPRSDVSSFDVGYHIRLVPPFSEKDVERYFSHFERVAITSKWPKAVWTLLLQSVLVGRAQEAYSALSLEKSADYDEVKAAILKAYELVPEAYRQRFRSCTKMAQHTYVEFAKQKENLFDRWCTSQDVTSQEELRQLILLEEFKNCLPEVVSVYLNEQKPKTLEQAAILADEFVLTHKVNFGDRQAEFQSKGQHKSRFVKSVFPVLPSVKKSTNDNLNSERACFYCKKVGHLIADCPVLSKKQKSSKTVACVSPVNNIDSVSLVPSIVETQPRKDHLAGSSVFLMDGVVCLSSDPEFKQPIKIWRDTGAFQSVILQDILPFAERSALGSEVLVKGFGADYLSMPLHNIHLQSDLITGDVVVALCSQIPIDGVSFILGNDLAGGKVLPAPEVTVTPYKSDGPDQLELVYPETFPVCVTTRAMSAKRHKCKPSNNQSEVSLYDTFLAKDEMSLTGFGEMFPSHEKLIHEQKQDPTLASLFEDVVLEEALLDVASGYFVSDGVLMRKWTDPKMSSQDDWSSVFQVVVPAVYRSDILYLAHDHCLSGHLGVKKTLDRVLRHFFWPGVKTDVAQHCRSCHVCQVVGKPNQLIPTAPLYPIPAIGEPFEHVLIDCVGPLPRTKSGNQFLLTIMCAATRFPEAVPLRRITAPAISKALIKFFTLFGLPKVVQSDQGSNFVSRLFSQVLKQLSIQHNISSAYHPESQGALERFHQTLKTMLKTYCKEFERDWDEGIPLLLFAVREVAQESLGFSPAELVFGHTVRGPLKLLKERWLAVEHSAPMNLLDYVSNFNSRLSRACELAKENLKTAQTKMKLWYDRKAKERVFSSGDQVLVLLPIVGSALEAKYSGPYVIDRKVGEFNYLVQTPDRKRKTRLCHVNLLKPYVDRSQTGFTNVKTLAMLHAPSTESEVAAVSETVQSRLPNSKILADVDSYLSYLNPSERSDIIQLVQQHLSLFSDVPSCTNVLEHDIDVGQAIPIKQHPYRVNPVKRQLLCKEVKYMLQYGIAEPSSSAWSSPCLLVEKPDGTHRFCTDFRKVNAITKPDSYPLPRLDDCIDRVGSATFVTKLDLLKGYWQVPLSQRAREISAFVTPDHFCHYNVMAFGMRNAPATFQRLVNKVLEGVVGCEAYLDDLVIFSSTWSQHLVQLEEVFKRLMAANLTLNLSKCEFGQATVTYLGKVVGHGHVSPIGAKVEAIVNFPVPSSRRELKRFLGMAGYYRAFCKNFATVAEPLTNLLSPKVSFTWTESCQVAFDNLKALLSNSPVLAAPDFNRPFKLATDASDVGVGAVLLQDDLEGIEHPVCYFSRKFDVHQKHYSTIEKEALALILSLNHFDVYVSSSVPLIVYTDHNPLVFLHNMRNTNQRLMRWSLFLQGYDLKICHIRGKDNVLADALSS